MHHRSEHNRYSAAYATGRERIEIGAECQTPRANQDEAAKIPNLIVGGRLGGYKYYDMDQAMAAALEMPIETNSAHQIDKML